MINSQENLNHNISNLQSTTSASSPKSNSTSENDSKREKGGIKQFFKKLLSKKEKEEFKKSSLMPEPVDLEQANEIVRKIDPNNLVGKEIVDLFSEEREVALHRLVQELEECYKRVYETSIHI